MAQKRTAKKESPRRLPSSVISKEVADDLPGLTPRQRKFLHAYEETASISQAAHAAKVHRSTHYQWLKKDNYRRAFQEIQTTLGDLLLDEAIRRALAGSDQLLQFLLRGLKPELFNRQQVEVVPPSGFAGVAVWQLSDEQLEEEIRRCCRILDG
jgi:hypothetical protein